MAHADRAVARRPRRSGRLRRSLVTGTLPGVLFLTIAAPVAPAADLAPAEITRVADPKLPGGGVEVSFFLLPPGANEQVIVEALEGAGVVRTISNAPQVGSLTPIQLFWDGRDDQGDYLDTGDYSVRVRLASGAGNRIVEPVSIVRLGVTEIEARDGSPGLISPGPDEFQMVYFKKNSSLTFYATPAIHEYVSVAEPGEVSDLDLDDGDPRPAVPLHVDTAQPAMDGANYATYSYNYPLCYLAGTRPRLRVVFGDSSTDASGHLQGVNYPLPGIELRLTLSGPGGGWKPVADAVVPGGSAEFTGPALPNEVARTDRSIEYSYRYSTDGGLTWTKIPGDFTIQHRFYTLIGEPNFRTDDVGQQYAGPWVEVADYVSTWAEALDVATDTEAGVVQAGIRGFFGQQGSLLGAIEGVIYDCYPLGGDGGANHYFINSQHRIRLAALLDGHANGVYVNCSDCAGSTSTMLAMMGVENVQLVHLGSMQLKAIWGIGAPAYTTNLWGGSHGFSFHKIITRDGADHVSDACMALDEDGAPETTPGLPGHNHDREWAGQPFGYDYLSSYNAVSRSLQALPKLT